MIGERVDQHPPKGPGQASPGFLHFAGFRYWTASLLPALVGTALPFWLRPRDFSFRWPGAIEFLLAAALFHAGFSFLQARFENRSTASWPRSRLLGTAAVFLVAGCFLGVQLNLGLTLHRGVPGSIFILYGLSALFVGALYVAPPFHFRRRACGEVVLCEGLGLLPVLGAYLVQVGDLTRTVYVASGPLVAATALWVWTDEIVTRVDDEREGRRTLVTLCGARFSGRLVSPALAAMFYAAFFVAGFTGSAPRWAVLIAALSSGLVWRIVALSRTEYDNAPRMIEARGKAFRLHLATCIAIGATSLIAPRG